MNQGKKSKTKKFPKKNTIHSLEQQRPIDLDFNKIPTSKVGLEASAEAKPIKVKARFEQTEKLQMPKQPRRVMPTLNKQKDSPMNQGKKIPFKKPKKKISPTAPKAKSMKQRIAEGKQKADAKKKSPLNNKENRAEVKAAKEGKSGKEKRQAARAVRKQQRKEGKRGIKKTIKKVEKTVAKVKDSKVYKVGKGIADTVANVKSGRIGAAIESGKKTIADAKKKKSDSPATMKKSKY